MCAGCAAECAARVTGNGDALLREVQILGGGGSVFGRRASSAPATAEIQTLDLSARTVLIPDAGIPGPFVQNNA
jgi:hypothetical protein